MLELTWSNQTKVRLHEEDIKKHLSSILLRLNTVGRVNLEVMITTDAQIQELNAKFRHIDQPTDVLSFENYPNTSRDEPLLGSIAVSADTAERQATEAGIPLEREIEMLCGHGLLHLLGYHHR
ncbi:rRNA maturation RNase YbeY [Candidatus Berkelbacteria bacterium RIFCSPLOWO2_01_FULL_50_28]|uniref:Endoribonuclease YbeY n=1 Tax=Candidatus Berkelbacteria bacterium RIFCSPLOWO2_01_FULL_50_28 TaxID=1797471 RepID=A0A1F5EBS2_9BACT|nr:MAG: rRNA maturation RNase YbeY [Candidatus Berkelbacteria bacterium RIFCSPHIGHO2_01_FULL_50_36]OGD62193.1 MAG: rRNA maturation RNase YbeY [Candidatus Berkelbacteria bacterium RIFCSPHIGHO2_12_FULL_50_11]OGD64835.1 MAG: rRNA maturation RNase YbeY [Candidatus Berkelbacteria bacterium RIFCSPLOWO2_01_FULL_50_28]